MTNAKALPIQEQLRDPSQEFRWDDRISTADRIDALEKALREIAEKRDIDEITRDEWYDIDFIRCGYDECIKIARDAAGERK